MGESEWGLGQGSDQREGPVGREENTDQLRKRYYYWQKCWQLPEVQSLLGAGHHTKPLP